MRTAVNTALALLAATCACSALAQKPEQGSQAAAGAQAYPVRPIRFICPYVPGGAGDIFTRTIAQKLAESLGQSVVVDNRPGANGGIGTDIVAKAPDRKSVV